MQVTHRMEVTADEVDNTFTISTLVDGRILLNIDTPTRMGLRDRKSIFLSKDALTLLGTTAQFFLEHEDDFELESPENATL